MNADPQKSYLEEE